MVQNKPKVLTLENAEVSWVLSALKKHLGQRGIYIHPKSYSVALFSAGGETVGFIFLAPAGAVSRLFAGSAEKAAGLASFAVFGSGCYAGNTCLAGAAKLAVLNNIKPSIAAVMWRSKDE